MATIKEIAKLAGVSPMTVSNVINKKHNKVSTKTIEKVEQVIRDLDYVPNMSARTLVSKSSHIIVLIIPQTLDDDPDKDYAMHNPFYGEMINSIEYNLRINKYYMMLRFVSEDEVYVESLKLWNADGVIVLGTDQNQFDLNLKKLAIPFVMIDSYVDDAERYCSVVNDDRNGGKLAADYLLDRGCENLGIVCTDISSKGVSQERYNGFVEGLSLRNKELEQKHIFLGYPSYEYGLKISKAIAESNLDGVFAFSDMMAFGIIEGLKNLGKRVPEDISVIGYDGLFVSEISSPKLTTVKQNIYEKGKATVDLMLKVIKDKDYIDNVVLPVGLLEKESVK
ncbi:LacI family DNA-binding transcriptional regulator [Acidaminobacter sp. JC074]|uniref:LacI family DNA-binding transcriptional regulator n=1 Tax=Acidaminobacter sp. JC074 TaxID=2530199 RepID=UPI001F0E4716|nr:LacI family DNA-binding transcriptional regulator [Acidaminobacter sp. JC074]